MIYKIKTFKNFANESAMTFDWALFQNKYETWEKGVIMAWGDLLYLTIRDLPRKLNCVSFDILKKEFENYYTNAEYDERLREWMSDSPPKLGGIALLDKNILEKILFNISKKTPIPYDIIAYRTTPTEEEGWRSYTIYNNKNYYAYSNSNFFKYNIPRGFPIIFASGLGDRDEIIINLSKDELKEFKIK